jgi:hypothetical protein
MFELRLIRSAFKRGRLNGQGLMAEIIAEIICIFLTIICSSSFCNRDFYAKLLHPSIELFLMVSFFQNYYLN